MSTEKPVRSFIAVDLPDDLKKEIAQLLASLRPCGADVTWVRPENLHLTLKFLGDVPPDRIAAVSNRLAALCRGQKAFTIRCAGLGGFPDLDRPKVLWVGVSEGEETLKALADRVDLEMAGLGFAKEGRVFSAHLTIGRVKSRKNLEHLIGEMKRIPFVYPRTIAFDHLTLYKSFLTSGRPLYEPIRVFPLPA